MNNKVLAWMVEIMLDTTIEWRPKKIGGYKRRFNHGV